MSGARPAIGLTVYGPRDDQGFNIPAEYVAAIVAAGGVPLLLPTVQPELAADWLARIDGLILAGGGDIDPATYGAEPHSTLYNLDSARDAGELALTRLALRSRLPTLAICRGMQLVNVALGGTLHQHLPDIYQDRVRHRAPPREPVSHSVAVETGSLLASIMGCSVVSTSSWHHQGVDRLADNLYPVAWAEDGCIEAFEQRHNDRLIAVQWHPEHTYGADPSQKALFRALVRMAAPASCPDAGAAPVSQDSMSDR